MATDNIITLTTDFGERDGYVAAMKAVIISIAGPSTIVDISHDIAPQDVMEAAFVLQNAAAYFPDETTHIVVVDPGVGTDRRAVAIRSGKFNFVGPDNGIFSLVLDAGAARDIVELDNPAFWRTSTPSNTFHGRDIFAPVGAHLSMGRRVPEVGSPVEALTPMHWALPISDAEGIQGWVVHVDRYGNCITNISRKMISESRQDRELKCYVGNASVENIFPTYENVAHGEPVAIYNSIDHLEIAVNRGNAAQLLNLRKGSTVNLMFMTERNSKP